MSYFFTFSGHQRKTFSWAYL